MKVFISWSKGRSGEVAGALKDFLGLCVQSLEPWVSNDAIAPGTKSVQQLSKGLENSKFGIICVTPENQSEPWLNYESGALANAVGDKSRACPYLLGLSPGELRPPMGQLQAVEADRQGTWKLTKAANGLLESGKLDEARLKKSFERNWPELEEKLEAIARAEAEEKPEKRPEEEMLEEVLMTVRRLSDRLEKGPELGDWGWRGSESQPGLAGIAVPGALPGMTGSHQEDYDLKNSPLWQALNRAWDRGSETESGNEKDEKKSPDEDMDGNED